jgi:hypothetical protein
LWSPFELRWTAGVSFANFFYDSRQSTPAALAVAGTGILERVFADHYYGFGPRVGFELAYHLPRKDLTLVCRVQAADLIGRIHQNFSESAIAANGLPVSGTARYPSSQSVTTLNVQVGPRWQPASFLDVFFGYEYEHWWNIFRQSSIGNSGMFYDQGVALRVSLHY